VVVVVFVDNGRKTITFVNPLFGNCFGLTSGVSGICGFLLFFLLRNVEYSNIYAFWVSPQITKPKSSLFDYIYR
jgi:hypothetical protein